MKVFPWLEQVQTELEAKIFGQKTLIEEALICLLAQGHLLITGAPGLAKTTLVKALSRTLAIRSGRLQLTPDVLPSDITGSEVLNIDTQSGRRSFEFVKGPLFTHLLLADEINRASPRTQSALLEAMQERAVTMGGKRYPLAAPFMVFATQNPFESEGTFVLPEAQLDRFLLHSLIDYPDEKAERKILESLSAGSLVSDELVEQDDETERQKLLEAQTFCAGVAVPSSCLDAATFLVRASRPTDEFCAPSLKRMIAIGAGPRGGMALIQAARAYACLQKRDHVSWDDVVRVAAPVLRHRIKKTAEAWREQVNEDTLVARLIEHTEQHFLAKGRGLSTP